jgi:hypothetical protein
MVRTTFHAQIDRICARYSAGANFRDEAPNGGTARCPWAKVDRWL